MRHSNRPCHRSILRIVSGPSLPRSIAKTALRDQVNCRTILSLASSNLNPETRRMHLSVSGKVALITGGSRGIGAAAVRMFVSAGARVLFSYEKSKTQADELVKELGGDKCAAVA